MTLRDRFRTGAARVFTAFESLQTPITYVMATGDSSYDPVTGLPSTPSISLSLNALIVPVQDTAVDGNLVRVGDRTVLIERKPAEVAADGQSQAFSPGVDDVVRVDGVDWQVTKVSEDPAGAMVSLNCREPG